MRMFITVLLFLFSGTVVMDPFTVQAQVTFEKNHSKFKREAAKKYIQSDEFKKVEKEIKEDLKTVPREKHYFLYIIAAKHCLEYYLFDKAREYLDLALLEDTKENKVQIYMKLLEMSHRDYQKLAAEKDMQRLMAYLEVNKSFKTPALEKELEPYQRWLSAKAL